VNADQLYSFVFRGVLAEEALDKAGRTAFGRIEGFAPEELSGELALSYIDEDFLVPARRMSLVYTAISAFENSVRSLVKKILLEAVGAEWWTKSVSDGIRKKAESRRDEEQKVKWHSRRGDDLIAFTDFGQLASVIVNNWAHFEDLLQRQQWVQHIFDTMERSRNVIMHSGQLPDEDVERVGICIRDWMKQTGG
jgi:HEPN superfamily Swt1-like protein